jgi:hypothetical protein
MLPARFEDRRHEALAYGLTRIGYTVKRCAGACDPQDERDIFLTWTRHKGAKEQACERFEEAGGRVVVAEEAHIRHIPNGPYPKDQYFSLCLNDHQGFWRSYGPERWASWHIWIKAWRNSGNKVLVREQRGIGSTAAASPPNWHVETAQALRRYTDRPIEVVTHPKRLKRAGVPVPRPEEQFADAWCVVTWCSHMGTEALLHGIPVIACGPRFFLSPACDNRLERIDDPPMPDNREPTFAHFAWAQWAMSEIKSGEAFKRLLG